MGRYGNQLAPYFLGRILSEKLKYKLFGPTSNTHWDFSLHDIDLQYNQPGYAFYETPIQQLGNHDVSDDFCNPDFNINDIINDNTPRRIILDGYFQRKKFFTPYREEIIKWFNMTPFSVHSHDVAMHIRLDDLRSPNNLKHLLPIDYYEAALATCTYSNVTICTDSPNDPYITHLIQKYNAKIFNGNEKNTISFLSSHNNLILSQGTFSFWASFFCNGDNIINAKPKTGWNSEDGSLNTDLLLSGDRYKYITL